MLEKNGTIVLTQEDLEAYNQGLVSDRLKQLWQLSFEELQTIVNNANYVKEATHD
jgi:hypothetical protein